jgi:hypothetical protein
LCSRVAGKLLTSSVGDISEVKFSHEIELEQNYRQQKLFMEPYSYAITALIQCFAYRRKAEDASKVSESEFVPFDLSYLRDLPEPSEKKPGSFGEDGRHESRLAPV